MLLTVMTTARCAHFERAVVSAVGEGTCSKEDRRSRGERSEVRGWNSWGRPDRTQFPTQPHSRQSSTSTKSESDSRSQSASATQSQRPLLPPNTLSSPSFLHYSLLEDERSGTLSHK